MTRPYRLGARQASVERTNRSILAAARHLMAVSPGAEVSLGAIAREAGVSRLTIYQRFRSRSALLAALAPPRPVAEEPQDVDAREALRRHLFRACESWAGDPALYRHLGTQAAADPGAERKLTERLLAADALRPGCSLREAEDVIGALASFTVFDRLHRDGRRSPAAVAEILMRLAGGIVA